MDDVKLAIKEELRDSYGVIFDGWTCDKEHYVAIFASWVNESGGICERLLACGVHDLPEDPDDTEDWFYCRRHWRLFF